MRRPFGINNGPAAFLSRHSALTDPSTRCRLRSLRTHFRHRPRPIRHAHSTLGRHIASIFHGRDNHEETERPRARSSGYPVWYPADGIRSQGPANGKPWIHPPISLGPRDIILPLPPRREIRLHIKSLAELCPLGVSLVVYTLEFPSPWRTVAPLFGVPRRSA